MMEELNFNADKANKLQWEREKIRKENLEYRKKHPEIHDIVSGFTSALMKEKPEKIFRFAFEYFRHFAKGETAELIRPKLRLHVECRISGKDFDV